jgi:chromosome segregation ATPase
MRVLLCFLVFLIPAVAQTNQPEQPSLLAEIRQLRTDMQAVAAAVQRVQIVIYRLQSQSVALGRATERLDQARAACAGSQQQVQRVARQIEQVDARRRAAQTPAEQKEAEDGLASLKAESETIAADAQQCQAELVEAENQFQTEQSKMSDLQEQLDKLEKTLATYSAK